MAVYRWSIVRSFFKAVHAFKMAGRQHRSSKRFSDVTDQKKKFHWTHHSLVHSEALLYSGFYLQVVESMSDLFLKRASQNKSSSSVD